ncbi:MAG: carboxypeptidase-like regulatory domain-containing protein, partial [Chloroflexota bacterium]
MKAMRMVVVCLVVLAGVTVALAQMGDGRLSGVVFDVSGAVVVGASVTATNEATGVARPATTNETGNFAFPSLPAGLYTVEVEYPG